MFTFASIKIDAKDERMLNFHTHRSYALHVLILYSMYFSILVLVSHSRHGRSHMHAFSQSAALNHVGVMY